MHRKLTITIDDDVYQGLHQTVGRGRISRFIEDLVRPHVTSDSALEAAYHAMAADAFADHPRAAEMGECRRRVEVLVADPAVSVAAFDCLDTAREWLKAQPGVIVIHPDTGESL